MKRRPPAVKPRRGRPSNRVERQAQIVDALLAVMAREGYGRATISAIAAEARLSPGLVHHHFRDKHEILVAMVRRLIARVDERSARRTAAAGDQPRRRLDAFVEAHVALGADADPRAVAAWVLVGAEALRDPEVQSLYARALRSSLRRLRGLVAACLRARGRPARDAAPIAAALLAATEGAYRLSAGAPGLLPAGFASPTLRRMIDGLLGPPEATA